MRFLDIAKILGNARRYDLGSLSDDRKSRSDLSAGLLLPAKKYFFLNSLSSTACTATLQQGPITGLDTRTEYSLATSFPMIGSKQYH